jgi:hypothetical protein
MTETHVISALVKRRAELAGEIEFTQQRITQMVADLESLDKAIRLFDGDYKVEAIRPKGFRPPSDWANRGEMSRIILDILRQAAEPLTTQDIARELIVSRGLDVNDKKLLRLMTKRAGVALRGQRDNHLVASTQGPGLYMVWSIIQKITL